MSEGDKVPQKFLGLITTKLLLPLIIVGSIVVVLAVLFIPFTGRPILSFVQKEDTSWHITILEEARDSLRFNTVQYVYKVVFPFDFMPPNLSHESIAARVLKPGTGLLQAAKGLGGTIVGATTGQSSELSSEEVLYLDTLGLAYTIGLRQEKPYYEFLVATVIVEAGIDFMGTLYEDPASLSKDDLEGTFFFEDIPGEDGTVQRRATLRVPDVRVTDVRIEDTGALGDSLQYPDVALGPGAWKKVADFIDGYYRTKAVQEGVLQDARDNAGSFLKALLESGGYTDVEIRFDLGGELTQEP